MRPLAALAALALACAPEPVYDEDLGLEAIPVEEGALAGTFAMIQVAATLAEFPVFGKTDAGSETYLLVERAYDPASGYAQTTRPCGGVIWDTIASSSFIAEAGWRSVPPTIEESIEIDDARGSFRIEGHVELWAIRDLPNPKTTPLPATQEEAAQPPHRDRFYDADDDGMPGITMGVSGFAEGDVYFAQRRILSFRGITLGEDRVLGLNGFLREQIVLGASTDLLNRPLVQEPHPDPKESWFEERRIADGGDCDDVMDALASGALSRIRPF